MKKRIFAIASFFVAFLVLGTADGQVVIPKGDITSISIAGSEISMLHTAIDLNNAHRIETMGFFKRKSDGAAEHIPFEINRDYQPFLLLRSGADCAISALRVEKSRDQLSVIYAHRNGGWSAKALVTFLLFKLEKNDEGAPGTPPAYFKLQKEVQSKSSYCDVNQAFNAESSTLLNGVAQ